MDEIDQSLEDMLLTLKQNKKKKVKKIKIIEEDIEDEEDNIYTYKYMLNRIYSNLKINNNNLFNKKRSIICPPHIIRMNNKILWINFMNISNILKRNADHIMTYVLSELETTGSIDGNNNFVIKGIFLPKYIESILRKYILEYVTCNMCKSIETNLRRNKSNRTYYIQCNLCDAIRTVSTIQKGYHVIKKGERKQLKKQSIVNI